MSVGQNGTFMMTRRSARANGLEPELRITDPVKLERRLKRQRGECSDVAMDSQGSEEGEGEGREPKRAKHLRGEPQDDDRDPLDCIGPSPNQSPRQAQQHVRFSTVEVIQSSPMPREGSASRTPQPGENHIVNNVIPLQEEITMANVSPRKQGGFDPSLLNPLSPSEETSQAPMANGIPARPIQDVDPSNPFFTPLVREASQPSIMSIDGPSQSQPSGMDVDGGRPNSPHRGLGEEQPQSQEPMIIERTPTPLPDFQVDEGLLAELRHCLADGTTSLTVEQLEQLRATCLGSVWRHRKEWNKYGLLRELLGIVREFVEEASDTWACNED